VKRNNGNLGALSNIRRIGVIALIFHLVTLSPCHLVTQAGPADKDREDSPRPFAQLKRGMTPQQVRQLLGAPKQIARQIFYHHYREQWLYDAAVPVRLTFDCPRGQKPQLLDNAEPHP
jgi:hypothetical protein